MILFFCFSVEIVFRVILTIKTKSLGFLFFGIVKEDADKATFQKIMGADGRSLYHKAIPSHDERNPINRSGFRGQEIKRRDPSTVRIICLGGSTTYGLGLDYKDTYPKLLQDELNKKSMRNHYEVINAGMPALKLSHIISLVLTEIIPLKPNIIILMSVTNNLVSDDQQFFFTTVEGEERNVVVRISRKLINRIKKYSLAVTITDDIVKKGFKDYLRTIDLRRIASKIMTSNKVWINYKSDIEHFIMIFKHNPSVKILVLDEAVNLIDYPELVGPTNRGREVLWDTCRGKNNVKTIAVSRAVMDAQQKGVDVWIASYVDPFHLSRKGNEIIAQLLAKQIISMSPI